MTKSTSKTNASKKLTPKNIHKAVQKKTDSKNTSLAPSRKTDLLKTVASLETRMNQANALTFKSVRALETAVMTLDTRTRKDNAASKAALTRKVNQLSAKLTKMVEKTQADVTSELKTVLSAPNVDNLQGALARADERLTQAEHAQAAAISKVNHHLASIAIAVDTRIEEEAIARKAAIAALKTESRASQEALTARIDTIETDTARAISRTGEKIVELSDELTRRGEASELSIREKVSEIALQTQTEFETYRAGLERRIDDLSQGQFGGDTRPLEASIAKLTARLEGLEYAVSQTPKAEPDEQTPPKLSVVALQPFSQAPPPQALSPEPQRPDAFSPSPQIAALPTANMPNPYLAEQTQAAILTEPEMTSPVEYNPHNNVASRQEAEQAVPPPLPVIEPVADFTQPDLIANTDPMAELSQAANLDQALPYADPAYAESNPTMDDVRIGGETDSRLNLPKLRGQNLRIAALATGVAIIGLVTVKGVFGSDDVINPKSPQEIVETAQSLGPNTDNTTQDTRPKPDSSAAPIGDYADNKAIKVAPSSDAAKTLNSAASAGDSVAQFQLGLSYLEQGRTNEGVALIRKSANQNQPAAQYRLAKLYEIGQGVTQNPEMARQLTERAARNGNRIAMHDLALYYAEGRGGVKADMPTAANWFKKAGERGVVDSQFNLGVLFESGQGLPKNMKDAFVWYSIAAEQGDQFAKTRVEALKTELDPADLATALARVGKFKPVKIDDAANGIFRNLAWAKSNKNMGVKASQIRQAQKMLTELGYEIGGADGAVGPKTRSAIMNFERSNSLPETGRVNAALIDRLELATGA